VVGPGKVGGGGWEGRVFGENRLKPLKGRSFLFRLAKFLIFLLLDGFLNALLRLTIL
jgi:hypothetical protein